MEEEKRENNSSTQTPRRGPMGRGPGMRGAPGEKAKNFKSAIKRLFKELKNRGYSGVLDTNDAIYGGFHARAPVVVFDMDSVTKDLIKRTTARQKMVSTAITAVTKRY